MAAPQDTRRAMRPPRPKTGRSPAAAAHKGLTRPHHRRAARPHHAGAIATPPRHRPSPDTAPPSPDPATPPRPRPADRDARPSSCHHRGTAHHQIRHHLLRIRRLHRGPDPPTETRDHQAAAATIETRRTTSTTKKPRKRPRRHRQPHELCPAAKGGGLGGLRRRLGFFPPPKPPLGRRWGFFSFFLLM